MAKEESNKDTTKSVRDSWIQALEETSMKVGLTPVWDYSKAGQHFIIIRKKINFSAEKAPNINNSDNEATKNG